MKAYDVTITETLKMTVEIEAESAAAAEQIVHDQWRNTEHILDADHFEGVKFQARLADRERENVR